MAFWRENRRACVNAFYLTATVFESVSETLALVEGDNDPVGLVQKVAKGGVSVTLRVGLREGEEETQREFWGEPEAQ